MLKKLKKYFLGLAILLSLSFSIRDDFIRVESSLLKKKNKIQVQIFFAPEYGIQKKPMHQINLYRLSNRHKKADEISEKIEKYGQLIQTRKHLKGLVSPKDKNYFSSLNKIYFDLPHKNKSGYAVDGKLFYCSFLRGVCSVYKFQSLILP